MATENKLFEPEKSSIGGMDANKVIIIFWAVAGILLLLPYAIMPKHTLVLHAAFDCIVPFFNLLAIVCPLVFFIIEKESKFVKFHALQCTIYAAVFAVINIALGYISWVPMTIDTAKQSATVTYRALINVAFLPYLLGIIMLALGAVIFYKAIAWEAFKLPVAGAIAEKQILDK